LISKLEALDDVRDSVEVKRTLDLIRSRIEAGGLEDDLTRLSQSKGEYFSRTFEYDSAIKYFRKALDFALENNDTSLLAMSYYNLGGAYCDVESYPYSTELYLNALDLWKAKKDTFRIAKTILAIANNYYYFGDFQIGQDYYKQSIDLFRLLGDTSNLSKSIGNSAALFAYKEQFDTAMALYDEALSLVKYSDYTDVFVNNLIGVGMVYEELGKYDTAYNFYKRAFYESKRIDYKIQESFSYLNFAYYFMYKEIFDSAEFYALKALDQSDIISNKLLKVNSYDVLHEIYYKTGQYKEAYDYLMLTKEKNDSLYCPVL
jgi:tetratricopeptide (TPR) repeat protein